MHTFITFTPQHTDWTQLHKVTTTGTHHVTHQHQLEA
jgi:hypothetical protein